MTSRVPARAVTSRAFMAAVAFATVVVGASVLKGKGDVSTNDPTTSVLNGAPRGLLGLRLFLASEQRHMIVRDVFGAAGTTASPRASARDADVLLVPPPERTPWSDAEVAELVARVRAGARVVIVCDDEEARTARLEGLLKAVGAECFRADVAIGDASVTVAAPVLSPDGPVLFVRGTGRVRPRGAAPLYGAWAAGTDPVVLRGPLGDGEVLVVGSATVLANDGLAERGNAAFALRVLGAGSGFIEVDERHHRSRASTELLAAAARGLGPLTALVAIVLLVPLSLLSLVPRPGDAPRTHDGDGAPAAVAQARALAAILARVDRGPRGSAGLRAPWRGSR